MPLPQTRAEGDATGGFILSSMKAFDVNQFIKGRRAVFVSPERDIYGYRECAEFLVGRVGVEPTTNGLK